MSAAAMDGEGTHSWLNRFRGLLTRWCNNAANYHAMLCLVCGLVAYQSCPVARVGSKPSLGL